MSIVYPVSYAQEVTTNISPTTGTGDLGTTVSQEVGIHTITGGTRPNNGPNLFHSFEQFNVGTDAIANFQNETGLATDNILSRVTGGALSEIDGMIRTTGFSGADLFLINPQGLMFGPNASLDVEGSFHTSTADYIRLDENARFDASNPTNSVLTTAPPVAFGFLDQQRLVSIDQSVLEVQPGETLSLVAGDVLIEGSPREVDGEVAYPGDEGFDCGSSCLRAPGGRIQIAAVPTQTEIPIDLSTFDVSDVGPEGEVTIRSHSLVDVSSDSAGAVFIRAGTFTTDTVELRANSNGNTDAAPIAVDIGAQAGVSMNDSVVGARSAEGVLSGSIVLKAETIELRDGTDVETGPCFGCDGGAGGAISMHASERIAMEGVGRDGEGVTIQTRTQSDRDAGDIVLMADTEIYTDNALITSVTEGSGAAGSTIIEAAQVALENQTQIRSETGVGRGGPGSGGGDGDGGQGSGGGDGSGQGGGGGQGSSGGSQGDGGGSNDGEASGIGGDLLIRAEESITLRQEVEVGANSNSSGNAGDVGLEAPLIQILDGSRVGSNVDAGGNSGDIVLVAGDSLVLAGTNGSPDPDRNRGSRITVGSRSTATGDAGSIDITAPTVLLADGARISSSTSGVGEGGPIHILANDSITLRGARLDGSGSSIRASTEVEAEEAGDVDAPRIADAGPIFIQTPLLVLEPDTEIVSNTSLPGQGGRVELQLNALNMTGATIQTTSTGTGSGNAGDIQIMAQQSMDLTDSSISTSATQSDGGNINLTVGDRIFLLNSDLTALVRGGEGNGGNITIDPIFVILNSSRITADAFGGNGGNIQIVSDFFFATMDSSVTASSALGIDGTVDIRAPDSDVTKSLTILPATFSDASALLRSRCGARTGQNVSSFVVAGRGGLPPRPEDLQPILHGEALESDRQMMEASAEGEPVTGKQRLGACRT